MKVFLTGATGFIGRALSLRLQRDGHEVVAWVRSDKQGRARLGHDVRLVPTDCSDEKLAAEMGEADAVINLAGEPIAGGRWTEERKRSLTESRVDLTKRLVRAIERAEHRPKVLLSGSAVGYYGIEPSGSVDEGSAAGNGFLAELCVAWERAATSAEELGVRVVLLRSGLVVGRDGGFLEPQLSVARMSGGAYLGDGHQAVPWVHLEDHLEGVVLALENDEVRGAINLVAPGTVTNREWTKMLASMFGKRVRMRVPARVLQLALGEASHALLGGAYVTPRRLKELGFEWKYPELRGALEDVTSDRAIHMGEVSPGAEAESRSRDTDGYLQRHHPTYAIETRMEIDAPLENVFEFFSKPENLGAITPSRMRWDMRDLPSEIGKGAELVYGIRVAGLPLRWKARIAEFLPGKSFVDAQLDGPYQSWWHEHNFERKNGHTVVTDRVLYSPPLGVVGRLAHQAYVKRQLADIFGFRDAALRLRFRPVERHSDNRLR